MLHDLTKRARLEGELGASEARWRAVVDSAVDAIIVIDAHGRVEAFNPAAERLFGYSAAEVCGQNVDMLMPSPYREEHDTYLSRYLATGRAKIIGKGREVQGRRKDGTTFPLHLSVGQMTMQGERKFTGILHDLTDRVQMEARLTRAGRPGQARRDGGGRRSRGQESTRRHPRGGAGLRQPPERRREHPDPEGNHRAHRRPRPDDEGSAAVRAPAAAEIFSDRRGAAGDLDHQHDEAGSGRQRRRLRYRRCSAAHSRGRRDAPDRLPESPDQWRARDAGKGHGFGSRWRLPTRSARSRSAMAAPVSRWRFERRSSHRSSRRNRVAPALVCRPRNVWWRPIRVS